MAQITKLSIAQAISKFGLNTEYYILDINQALALVVKTLELIERTKRDVKLQKEEVAKLKAEIESHQCDDVSLMQSEYGVSPDYTIEITPDYVIELTEGYLADFGDDSSSDFGDDSSSGAGTRDDPITID